MRTKALLLTAVIAAAGVATSLAQVFSVNAVGYVNVTVPKGQFKIIANPLNNGDNKISTVLTGVPGGFVVYTYNGTSFGINGFDAALGWDDPDQVIAPGTGLFVKAPAAADANITFVGEVPTGTQTVQVPEKYSLIASKIPQAGKLQTELGYTPADGDIIYQYTGTGYLISAFDAALGGWEIEPTVAVAEGMFVFRKVGNAGTWTRTFNL